MSLNIFEAEIKMDTTAQTIPPGHTLAILDAERGEAMKYRKFKNMPIKKFENDGKHHLQMILAT